MKIKYTDELSHSYYIGPGPGNRWREKNGQFGHDPDPNYGNTTVPGHHDVPYERLAPTHSNVQVSQPRLYKETHNAGSGSHQYTYNTSYGSPSSSNTSSSGNSQATPNANSQATPNINLKDIKTLAGVSSTAGKEIAKTADLFTKPKQGKRIDVSNMSDDDLRAILNRERMEREYNNYFNPPQVNKGAEVVKGIGNFISTSGTIALTALQAVEIIRGFAGN